MWWFALLPLFRYYASATAPKPSFWENKSKHKLHKMYYFDCGASLGPYIHTHTSKSTKRHWSASFGWKTIKIDQVSARALHTSTQKKGSHDVLWSLLWCVECIPYNGRRRKIFRLRAGGWSPWSQPQAQWWCWSSCLLGRCIRSHRSLVSASYWLQLTLWN